MGEWETAFYRLQHAENKRYADSHTRRDVLSAAW
jgi:hypothetical protein